MSSWTNQSCHYCEAPATTSDHVVPKGKGGPDAQWNQVPACDRCNRLKGDNWPSCQCKGCRNAFRRFNVGVASGIYRIASRTKGRGRT